MSTTEALQQTIGVKEKLLKQMSELKINFTDSLITKRLKENVAFMRWQNKSNSVQTTIEKRQAKWIENGLLLTQQNRINELVYRLKSFFRDVGKEKAKQVGSSPK